MLTKRPVFTIFVMQRTSYWLGDRSRHLGYFGFLQKSRAAKKKSAIETSGLEQLFPSM
jgi:hypothetical protein